MFTLVFVRTFIPVLFTAVWVYFFIQFALHRKIMDRRTLFGLPTGIFFASVYLYTKWSPTADQIVPSFLLMFIFMSSLIACTISDLFEMTIPRICSIWLAPFWLLFSKLNFLPTDFTASTTGAIIGFLIPWSTAKIFKTVTGKDGLGQGDIELLCMIGAFSGPTILITTLNLASISCLLFALIKYAISQDRPLNTRFPFAPFISFGTLVNLLMY